MKCVNTNSHAIGIINYETTEKALLSKARQKIVFFQKRLDTTTNPSKSFVQKIPKMLQLSLCIFY